MRETLSVGGIAVAITCDEPGSGPLVCGPERLFLTDDRPDFTVDVHRLEHYEPPRGGSLFDSGLVWSLHRDGEKLRIECRSPLFGPTPYKYAVVDDALTHADVFVTKLIDPLEFPLGELLFNALLAQRGAIEVHACGVIENGEGTVFLGNSGDGKTTTARLWQQAHPDAELVSDDRIILVPERVEDRQSCLSGDDRQDCLSPTGWWMYGTPWHGEAEICSPSRAPLRRVFALDKATSNAVTPLSPAHAAARILACAFPPFHDPQGMQTFVGIAANLATAVPVARLSFVNDPSAVAFVRAA